MISNVMKMAVGRANRHAIAQVVFEQGPAKWWAVPKFLRVKIKKAAIPSFFSYA
ncbi:hypothetical protein IQ265_10335 [Nodosilinea sp. LEGE 06152]|uniref:hypothetical protein n=1 Tax=Nodosilinea sp. LEGE 06152 TaxID=2777966 RepID=UPI0018813679|nr:hypothetical protein [Nodosilinea sp. LEGE 06152]MBE9157219.1 hypothetical protein [Nodosilinea sp. LEGE 06152]